VCFKINVNTQQLKVSNT